MAKRAEADVFARGWVESCLRIVRQAALALEAALGGKDMVPADPVRHGADDARIELDLGEIIVRRIIKPDRSTSLVVTNADGTLAGVFTHGDFVRAFQNNAAIGDQPVRSYMTARPISISADALAAVAGFDVDFGFVDEFHGVTSWG